MSLNNELARTVLAIHAAPRDEIESCIAQAQRNAHSRTIVASRQQVWFDMARLLRRRLRKMR